MARSLLDEITVHAKKAIIPGLADYFFKSSPLLRYLQEVQGYMNLSTAAAHLSETHRALSEALVEDARRWKPGEGVKVRRALATVRRAQEVLDSILNPHAEKETKKR